MTTKDTMKLAKENGGFNFSRSANAVLLRMIGGTNRKVPAPDISLLKMETRITTVMKWASVTSVRQADRIIAELVDSGVLRIATRAKGKISYSLDPSSLRGLVPSTTFLKDKIKGRNEDRASKARAQRAAIRTSKRELDENMELELLGLREQVHGRYTLHISAATRRKHASLPLKAETPTAAGAGSSAAESEPTRKAENPVRRRGPIKVASAPCAAVIA